jgi:hypothetical protein
VEQIDTLCNPVADAGCEDQPDLPVGAVKLAGIAKRFPCAQEVRHDRLHGIEAFDGAKHHRVVKRDVVGEGGQYAAAVAGLDRPTKGRHDHSNAAWSAQIAARKWPYK